MTEYTVLMVEGEAQVIEANSFNHAVSEAVDQWGWPAIKGILPFDDYQPKVTP